MENKNQKEALIIEVSTLTCIDLANSDLHQSAVLLKQVFYFFLKYVNIRIFITYVKNIDTLWVILFKACSDSGFFYVINHGISEELNDQAFEQSKKFFALPLEEKMKVLRNDKFRGYAPICDQLLDPNNQVRGLSDQLSLALSRIVVEVPHSFCNFMGLGDYKEGFTIGTEGPKNGPYRDKPLYSPNIWPNPG